MVRGLMNDAKRQQLAADYVPLALSLAARMLSSAQRADLEGDDIVSDAQYGLVLAARDFDEDMGVPWVSFATLCIWRAMTNGLKKRNPASQRTIKRVSIDAATAGGQIVREALVAGDAPVGTDLETKDHAADVMRRLQRDAQDRIRLGDIMAFRGLRRKQHASYYLIKAKTIASAIESARTKGAR